jgi:hypothetical protein
MFSMFKTFNDDKQFLIVRFVIHFCENHFSREKRNESSLFIRLQLRDNVDDFIIERVRFQFDEKFRIEVRQNESILKDVSKQIKSLSCFFNE